MRLHLVNAFIGEEEGATQPFHINRHGESSSGLPANPEAADEICPVPYYPLSAKWGVNTELERKEAFTTRNLETLIGELGVVPDVLSIDAQGMELMIMRGTGRWLQDIPALVTEVEFFPIYAGQGLFSDQDALLKAKGFRLAGPAQSPVVASPGPDRKGPVHGGRGPLVQAGGRPFSPVPTGIQVCS